MLDIQNYTSFVLAIVNATARQGVAVGMAAVLVLVGNLVAARLKSLPSARKLATRLGGLALIGFGLKLAANNR